MAPKAKVPRRITYSIDCTLPVKDKILDIENFHKYLVEHIKVNGKTGNFGNDVVVEKSERKIMVTVRPTFSKRYLKYLTKKYLKKQQLRDYLRVMSRDKAVYKLEYFSVNAEAAEAENKQ